MKQRRYRCSGPSTDSTNYRSCGQISFQPDWQINDGVFNKPIMVSIQIMVHRWGPEQGFWRFFADGRKRMQRRDATVQLDQDPKEPS